jgi:electron transport complex protein RnfC
MGCVFFNASSCVAIYNAVVLGMPLIERVVTVDGDCVKTPKNLLAPIGASYLDLINYCGGLVKTPQTVVSGGPMMGAAQWDINGPVTKGTSAILVLSADQFRHYDEPSVCIRCGRCVNNCPMHLMPNYLVRYARLGKFEETAKLGVMSCVECGTCSYNCPGHMMIVQHIRVAKGALRAKK